MGCLLGVCVGDAWGAPYEFKDGPLVVADRYGRGVFGTEPGAPTDDSTLALLLAEALLEQSPLEGPATVDWSAYTRRLVKWWASGPPDIGAATARAARAWGNDRAPSADDSVQGNGSLMAAAAIGIGWASRPDSAGTAGRTFAALTHPSKVAADINASFCELLAHLISHGSAPSKEAFRPERPCPSSGPGARIGWARLAWAVATDALWSTMQGTVAPIDALRGVIAEGGDTDTNAAITGALLGAAWGREAFESWQLDTLEERRRATELAVALSAQDRP